MEIDAEMRRKIAVSVGAVGVFIALVVVVGSQYTNDHHLNEIGGYALVGIVALFVVLMALVGLFIDAS